MRTRGRVAMLAAVVWLSAACGADGASPATEASAAPEPQGVVRVAYPDVPVTWSGLDQRDTAALDLFALWGLPLFRVDPAGQLRPGLATAIRHPEGVTGWAVDVDLAPGRWSDGSGVTPADVVATATALAEARPGEWRDLAVTAVDDDTVRFSAPTPVGRWAYLLSGAPGVLPAAVLERDGLAAYADGVPVSGGWFRPDEVEPMRSMRFVAHADGPLGTPRAASVEVDVVPRYEAALGLLADGRTDLVLGHLALNPVARASRLDGVSAAAPIGGTWLALEWQPGGRLSDDAEARRSVADALDLRELVAGLLGPHGAPATSPVPGVPGPWAPTDGATAPRDITRGDELVLLVPRWHEALGFTARVVQRDVRAAGGASAIVGHESPTVLDPPEPVDVALRVRRSLPRPALDGLDHGVAPGPEDVVAAELEAVFAELRDREEAAPLYRIGVAHAWRDGLEGVRPSSWPGLAMWDAGAWRPAG